MKIPEGAIRVTISLGAATSDRERMTDADYLVRAADQALYRVKENGRNRVETALNVNVEP